jgi:N-acetyl-anhydromuramyl-L-alanine amidase AmpD
MLLEKGDKGRMVKEIQTLLDFHGYWTYHKFTEYFGGATDTAVRNFQKAKRLTVDGKVGNTTFRYLHKGFDTDEKPEEFVKDTDNKLDMKGSYTTKNGLEIDRAYLDTDEYVRDYGEIEPLSFFIHHTAGWNNPYNTINHWNKDKRGRVATQYCIGGTSIKKGKYGDAKYNGQVVECFPDNYIGWHLGKVGNFEISKLSSAVEINNFGYAEKKDGKYYNYVGTEVPEEMVCDLGYEFRGHQYWHKYTDEQIESLKQLIIHVHEIYPSILITKGLPELLANGMDAGEAFEFNEDAYHARQHGLWNHTSVRSDKYDMFPQPELVEMLKWVYCNL